MNIHFFTERSQPRIDFKRLLDEFFPKIPNCEITSNDEEVDVKIKIKAFDFAYSFKITKRNTLRSIYTLDKNYIYTNMYVTIVPTIPSYLDKMILKVVEQLCNEFHLAIYHELIKDITTFNMLDILCLMYDEKFNYIKKNDLLGLYINPEKMINCSKYLLALDEVVNHFDIDTDVKPYEFFYDKEKGTCVVAYSIDCGMDVDHIIPPYLDYIILSDRDSNVTMISYDTFLKFCKLFLKDVQNKATPSINELGLKMLAKKNNKAVLRNLRRLQKYNLSLTRFNSVKVNEIIEKD